MASGVLRPYNLIDVLGTINDSSQASQITNTISGLGYFAEVDETVTLADSVVAYVQPPPVWDATQWGATTWS